MARKAIQRPGKLHPLYLNPEGKMVDFEFGVLRAAFSGRRNSTHEFVTAKLARHARAEVLLPPDVPDIYADPSLLWSAYEAARLPDQRDLATCVTVYCPAARTLHGSYEEVRAWALTTFAHRHALPVSLVLHAPGLSASAHDVHVHVIVAARALLPFGWGRFSPFVRDAAQGELHASWCAHRAAWGGRGA